MIPNLLIYKTTFNSKILFSCLFLIVFPIYSQSFINDSIFEGNDTLFFDSNIVESTKQDAANPVEMASVNKESVSFCGRLSGDLSDTITRNAFDGDQKYIDCPYSSSVEGDFLLDFRFRNELKAFINFWTFYSPRTPTDSLTGMNFSATMKEFFVDANILRRVYFRLGKQTLKWGQGYYWNPTDLITVDRKNFGKMDTRREGVYGLKLHIPFGTFLNIYGFINATGATEVEKISGTGKIEFLIFKDIEISFSGWKKFDYISVFGMDFSTYKIGMNLWGEVSLSKGDNRHKLEKNSNTLTDIQPTDWSTRVCCGFSKNFDIGNFADCFNFTGEFYYNQNGYSENLLEDKLTKFKFLSGNYFEPSNYGKYYGAMFLTLQRLFIKELQLKINTLGNISDYSGVISTALEYEVTFNVYLRAKVDVFLGEDNREYTFHGNALSTELSLKYDF